jgi:aspartate kinase
MSKCENSCIVVIKLGGSVLPDEDSYGQAARFLVRRLHKCSQERFVVVVSAQDGHTDELERVAREIARRPSQRTLDLLWSTGELRSVALLALHLEGLGVAALGLNTHEAGLRWKGSGSIDDEIEALSAEVYRAFDDHSVAVVPGFLATLASGTIVSLGRGGSDLSAVLLADALDAKRCELIKDVDGYFSEDPHLGGRATHLPELSYETALKMADDGCELVQRRALEAARKAGLRLVVRGLDEDAAATIVSENGNKKVKTDGGPFEVLDQTQCSGNASDCQPKVITARQIVKE